MKLENIVSSKLNLGLEAIASDKELAAQIQSLLIKFRLLEPPADGKFGPMSCAALDDFAKKVNSPEIDFIGAMTATSLLEADEKQFNPQIRIAHDLPSLIVEYMLSKQYFIATNPNEFNIVYVEGMNEDGTLNNDAPNQFNDLRMLIGFVDCYPKIFGKWQSTTEPGNYYTIHPMNAKGAARIKFGQYKAWQFGTHGNAQPHEALVQVAQIAVCRDFNQDFKRTGDKVDVGLFAVNQHWGYDYPANDIHNSSAGCLVGRTRAGHREFMAILKGDRRYQANPRYIFYTTIIPGDELLDSKH